MAIIKAILAALSNSELIRNKGGRGLFRLNAVGGNLRQIKDGVSVYWVARVRDMLKQYNNKGEK